MRQVITALTAMTCLVCFAAASAQAQVPKTVSVGFTNRTDINLIVKGYTIINGVPRGGPTLQIDKSGGRAFETNVPIGIRYYTVFDANFKILLRDFPVPIQGRNVLLDIAPSKTNPNRVVIVPAQ